MHWQPYQGYRTFAQQNSLYAQGRTAPGKIVTNAKGGESAHCWGCASDWTLFDIHGQVIWLDADDSAWEEYEQAIDECGLKKGSDFGDIDHNELHLKCSWKDILAVYNQSGMSAAESMIKRMKS